jgi:hypothetical protein
VAGNRSYLNIRMVYWDHRLERLIDVNISLTLNFIRLARVLVLELGIFQRVSGVAIVAENVFVHRYSTDICGILINDYFLLIG